MKKFLDAYLSSIILVVALAIGAILGIYYPTIAIKLKPIGEIFLNFLFMLVTPLVAISIMASISSMTDLKKLGKILIAILVISILMALIPSVMITGFASILDIGGQSNIELASSVDTSTNIDVVNMISTNDFVGLFSKKNLLALIIMSILTGIGIGKLGESGKKITSALELLNQVIMNVLGIIMKVAPIGLACYFAATMADQDPKLISSFGIIVIYFLIFTLFYYIVGSTVYSFIAGGTKAVKIFWQNAIPPSVTSLATSSSLATLPVTMNAGKAMNINNDVLDISLPLLVNLNKGGVAMITAFKIFFIYAALGLPYTIDVFLIAMIISVISAIIVGGIPGGGYIGEIFIVSTLHLPIEIIPVLIIIGTLTDAAATLINVIHDLPACQLIERFVWEKQTVTSDNNIIGEKINE